MLTKQKLAAVLGVGVTALIAGLGFVAQPASAAPWRAPAPPVIYGQDRHADHGHWDRAAERRRHDEWLRLQQIQRERERSYHIRLHSDRDYQYSHHDRDQNYDRDQSHDWNRDHNNH